jgi:pseudouridine synthase
MRLLHFLTRAGEASRRKAFDSIRSGQVTVNGVKIIEPSFSLDDSRDIIVFNGKRVTLKKKDYLLLYKPKGVITTVRDRFAKKTVMELVPKQFRHLYPVGRLDKETTGLLLMTNDGEMAYRLTHPSFETQKKYRVRLDRKFFLKDRHELERGIHLDGVKTAPCRIRALGPKDLEITIHEGRKRQIRRAFFHLGYRVVELIRIQEGSLSLRGLKPGAWRLLEEDEVMRLYRDLEIR